MAEAQAQPGVSAAAPWSARLFAAFPVAPLWLAAATAGLLFATFLAMELATGGLGALLRGEGATSPEEYRFTLVFSMLIGYLPAAFAYGSAGSRRTLEALRPVLRCSPAELARLREGAGSCDPRALRRSGFLGAGVSLLIPPLVDLSTASYDLAHLHGAALAHRLMLPVVGWLAGRFIHATMSDSTRLARIGRDLVQVDLLDLTPLTPFARHGLRNALLGMGLLSILSLLLVDWSARPGTPMIFTGALALSFVLAAAGLLLPVRGARTSIRRAKQAELAWCAEEIRRRRAAFGVAPQARESGAGELADLVSYRALVEGVREWPFDAPIMTRFALYLAIPVGSWLGGAMVERLVDALLG